MLRLRLLQTEREAEAARLEAESVAKAARLEAESVLKAAPLETEWANPTASKDETEESSIGGMSTCIVCMTHDKTHLAYPCDGHQCVCEECSKALKTCPYCRIAVAAWVHVRVA